MHLSLRVLFVQRSIIAISSWSSARAMSSSSHNTIRKADGVITVSPRDESKLSGLMVICHGLGDTAEGFVDVAEQMASQMPYMKFVLPTAATRRVTMNMGMPMPAWYDITGLDERSNENSPGLEDSVTIVRSLLEAEHNSSGLPYNRMMLGGFSMGGALCLFTGMSMPDPSQKLAGIAVLSGYLVSAKKLQVTKGLESTPIFHGHGTSDPLVIHTNAVKSKQYMLEHGVTSYELKSYQGMQHTVIPEEIADWLNFCRAVLPPGGHDFKPTLKDPTAMSVKELKEAIRNAGLGSKAVGLMEKSEFVKLVQEHRNTCTE